MRKGLAIGMALVMVLMGFIMIGGGAAATGTTWYVDDSGNNANGGTSWADAWRDINYAIGHASVTSGDTIMVGDGTYSEDVTITYGLTLTSGSSPIIVGGIWIKDIHTFTDPITVENFVIQEGTSIDATHDYGIKISGDIGLADQNIVDMHIVGNTLVNCGKTDDVSTEMWWNAAIFYDANHFGSLGNRYDTIFPGTGEISQNTIINNLGDPNQRTQLGIGVRSGRNMKINDNDISGNVAEGIHHWGPVNTVSIGNYEINHNDIDLSGWIGDPIGNNPRGIWSYAPQSSVSHNTAISKLYGMVLTYWDDTYWGGGTAGPNYALTVSHNIIHPPAGDSMYRGLCISGSNSMIFHNEIYGATSAGLTFEGWGHPEWGERTECSDNIFEYNNIHDNYNGIYTWYPPYANTFNNEFHYNKIVDNTNYGFYNGHAGEVVDAQLNWWGHPTGPLEVDEVGTEENPHGASALGDSVSDDIDFIPWYATETTTPSTEYVSVIHNPVIALSDTIQGGIDAALDGDTVRISSGIYIINTQILIDKGLNVRGDPVNNPVIKTGNAIYPYMMRVDNSVTTPVNIANIVFDGIGQNVYGGLRLGGSNSGSVSGCTFRNIKYSTYLGFGIVLYGDSYLIENNILSNIERVGIWIGGSTESNTLVKNNVYTGKGIGDWLDYGIEVGYGGIATIQGNIITDCTGVASSDGSTSAGILVTTYYAAGTRATIIDNTIERNTVGIHVGYDSYDTSIVVANCNNILDNTDYGVYSTAPQVDATANWWGEISGPYHPTLNPFGTGNAVGDYIDFVPWSYRTDPCKPKSKGFWKTHPDAVDAILNEYGPIYLGDFAVEDSGVAYEIFVKAKARNANTMLAAELLATKLNILHIAHLGLDGSISYWALNEDIGTTAIDTVGPYDGTIFEAIRVSGIAGNALEFDAFNDYVGISSDSDNSIATSLTLEAWIKCYSNHRGGIISNDVTFTSKKGFDLFVWDGRVYFDVGNGISLGRIYYIIPNLEWYNEWHHVVGTWDGTEMNLYIDGVNVKSGSYSGTYSDPNRETWIGRINTVSYSYPNWVFDGIIDEARIFNKALCSEMISLHHTMGLADQFLSSHGYNGPDDPGIVKGPQKAGALELQKQLEAFNKGEGICL